MMAGTVQRTAPNGNDHTYVAGLKDLGGSLEYGANLTDDLVTFWDTLINAHDVAAAGGKATWFVIVHPKLAMATYFQGDPSPIGLNEAEVGGMAETTLYITPTSAPILQPRPTTENTQLSALTVGNLPLTPSFNADTTSYTATTTHDSDVITAVPVDSNATVTLASDDATIADTVATWAAGANAVTITVENGTSEKVYTVTVTKSAQGG